MSSVNNYHAYYGSAMKSKSYFPTWSLHISIGGSKMSKIGSHRLHSGHRMSQVLAALISRLRFLAFTLQTMESC